VLTEVAGFSAARYQDWLKAYYHRMFLSDSSRVDS
jgi:hypothetical protein